MGFRYRGYVPNPQSYCQFFWRSLVNRQHGDNKIYFKSHTTNSLQRNKLGCAQGFSLDFNRLVVSIILAVEGMYT
jgi:hypothetical protein